MISCAFVQFAIGGGKVGRSVSFDLAWFCNSPDFFLLEREIFIEKMKILQKFGWFCDLTGFFFFFSA